MAISSSAYTDEVVTAIKHSRRVIIILSPAYISGPSIFELQAAVNCALEDKNIKLVLIRFQAFQEPEVLPPVVKKALRVLPVITWKSSISAAANKNFWKYMHYHMPVKTTKMSGNCSLKGFFQRLFSLVYCSRNFTEGWQQAQEWWCDCKRPLLHWLTTVDCHCGQQYLTPKQWEGRSAVWLCCSPW